MPQTRNTSEGPPSKKRKIAAVSRPCLRCFKALEKDEFIECIRQTQFNRCQRCVRNSKCCVPMPFELQHVYDNAKLVVEAKIAGKIDEQEYRKKFKGFVSDVNAFCRAHGISQTSGAAKARAAMPQSSCSSSSSEQVLRVLSNNLAALTLCVATSAKAPQPNATFLDFDKEAVGVREDQDVKLEPSEESD